MEMKEKSKNVNVRFYNVVIHPSDKHERFKKVAWSRKSWFPAV